MKIIKFIKGKNSMYILELDNGFRIKVHEDLILKYELLLKKEVDDTTLEKINEENKMYEIYEVALKYINVKLRSKKELKIYLIKKEYSDEIIDEILKLLEKQGYINDKTYAISYVHDRITLSYDGPLKIKAYLSNQGISEELIEDIITNYNLDLEKERIEKIINKQIKINNNKGANLLRKKIQMYLLNLGYDYSLINELLSNKQLSSPDLYKKEYDKLYKQLSKKYSGKELEYRLKQKMYQKGFSENTYE